MKEAIKNKKLLEPTTNKREFNATNVEATGTCKQIALTTKERNLLLSLGVIQMTLTKIHKRNSKPTLWHFTVIYITR